MYENKLNEHKLRRSYNSERTAKRSARRKKKASQIMTVIIAPEQYEALERASQSQSGIILNVVSASNIKKRKSEPFIGSLLLMLA